jgi:hypothetical protein
LYDQVDPIPENYEIFRHIAKAFKEKGNTVKYALYTERFLAEDDKYKKTAAKVSESSMKDRITLLTQRYENELKIQRQNKAFVKYGIILVGAFLVLLFLAHRFSLISFRFNVKGS